MLSNVIDDKTDNFTHEFRHFSEATGSARAEPGTYYQLKRDSENGLRSNCGALPSANRAAISPKTEANLNP